MLKDGLTHGRTMDENDHIAHPEYSSGELKTPAKFQKDRLKTVRGVASTRYLCHCFWGRTESWTIEQTNERTDGRTNQF